MRRSRRRPKRHRPARRNAPLLAGEAVTPALAREAGKIARVAPSDSAIFPQLRHEDIAAAAGEAAARALAEDHADIFVGRLYGDLRAAEGEDGAINRLHNARLLAAVDAALATLPGEELEAGRRKYQHEETNGEIAAALGVSVGTAQRRVSAAMSKVRCALRTMGFNLS
jgi:DNA-directed RNA polymerase specialized sigma24 family protein